MTTTVKKITYNLFNIYPKNACIKFNKRDKKNKTGAKLEPATNELLAIPSSDWATRKCSIVVRYMWVNFGF